MADGPTLEDPRALLRQAVSGQDDAALLAFAENLGGIEGFLDLTFEGMRQALDPSRAQDGVIGWELRDGDRTFSYVVSIEGGTLRWERREPTDARVTLAMQVPTYIRLVAGDLDPMQAFMQGAIQLRGDMLFAAGIAQMFGAGPGGA